MDYTKTKKAFRQIEEWRKETGELEQKHINNITDKDILLYLAKKQSELLDFKDWFNNLPDESDDRLYITDETIDRFKSNCS